MGTIIDFEQDPLRARMRKAPKGTVENSVVLPFAEYRKDTAQSVCLIRKDDEKNVKALCRDETLQPA